MCRKGFGHWLESYTGDLDTAFAYRTARTLTIRDKRLGLGLLALQGIIFLYIIVYQITLTQVYFAVGDLNSVVRLQLQAPTANYRWPGGAPPYCKGVSTVPSASDYPLAAGYSLPGDGTFTKDGVSHPQRLCNFFDETTAVPIVETDRMFVTSETRTTLQSTSPECSDLGQLSCVFLPPYNRNNGNVTQRAFVADIELFTLLIDHNMNSPLAGLHYASTDMEGKLLSASGGRINPCDDYAGLPGGCPTMAANGFDVALGSPGKPDIVPLRTLLRAAGISSLDTLAGLKGADAGESHREAGLVLNVDISYTNYYLDASSTRLGTGSMNTSKVTYTYQVSTVRGTEYKLITGVSPFGNATVRQNLNRHGMRIIVSTSGRVGYFNFMTMLINLNVAAGLLGLTYLLMDNAIASCSLSWCPLRDLYQKYKVRATPKFSVLRHEFKDHPDAMAKLQKIFEKDDNLVDPSPDLHKALEATLEQGVEAAAAAREPSQGGEGKEDEGGGGRRGLHTPLLASNGQ